MKRLLAAAITTATIVVGGCVAGASAQADGDDPNEYSYGDANKDAPTAIDVTATFLDVGASKTLKFEVDGREFVEGKTDVLRLFVDVNKNDSGPEYIAQISFAKTAAGPAGTQSLYKTDTWDYDSSKRVDCKINAFIDYRRDFMYVKIPRKCLGDPDAITWSGFVADITSARKDKIYGRYDDFPAERTFPTGGLLSTVPL